MKLHFGFLLFLSKLWVNTDIERMFYYIWLCKVDQFPWWCVLWADVPCCVRLKVMVWDVESLEMGITHNFYINLSCFITSSYYTPVKPVSGPELRWLSAGSSKSWGIPGHWRNLQAAPWSLILNSHLLKHELQQISFFFKGLSHLVAASFTEDQFGVVQTTLPAILNTLLTLQEVKLNFSLLQGKFRRGGGVLLILYNNLAD